MTKKITTLVTLIFSLAFFTTTAAAWQIELTSEDNLDWEVLFTSDAGGNELVGYFLELEYDTSELSWEGYTNTPPDGITAGLMGSVSEKKSGYINNFNAYTMGAAVTVTDTISLGTLAFTGVSSVNDGISDLQFTLDSDMFGLQIDGSLPGGDALTVVANQEGYYAVSSNAVPVPGAVWLMGSGLFGLLGFRRRKFSGNR